MGIDHYLLAATLRLVIAQRLVRTVCRECNAEGCEDCNQIGFYGRTVITEVCNVDEGMQRMITERRSLTEMLAYAKTKGFRPMYDDGMEKVDWGITTKEELLRVLSD
jgi:type II secretory ATPase GspE/PulE/Tfp pilus assembly ATPase PilB-like protein